MVPNYLDVKIYLDTRNSSMDEKAKAGGGTEGGAGDHIDRIQAQWAREMPQVSTEGAAILGRARRITLKARKEIEANFKRHGLDTGEFDVLATLRRSGEPYTLRPTELFTALMVSSGGMTDRLQRLEAAGFIARRKAADDARSLLVELTPAGRQCIEAAFRAGMEIEDRLAAGLDPAERETLVGLLRKLAVTIGA